jgi:hypothetical protein
VIQLHSIDGDRTLRLHVDPELHREGVPELEGANRERGGEVDDSTRNGDFSVACEVEADRPGTIEKEGEARRDGWIQWRRSELEDGEIEGDRESGGQVIECGAVRPSGE